jgi:hypothetical protein
MGLYGAEALHQTRRLIGTCFDLGTQNLVVPLLAFRTFEDERGPAYTEATANLVFELLRDDFVRFYQDANLDPYFTGIDTLFKFPERELPYRVARACADFQQAWPYQEGRRKLIWEVAPIPLYSIWRAHEVLGEAAQAQLEAALERAPSLQAVHDLLYQYYARAVYGTEIPMPHFYLGSNRNGDLKLRAMLPIALLCGSPTRLYFTPYPSMFITAETIQAMLENLAFGTGLRSTAIDYRDRLTPEFVEQEYERVYQLSQKPTTMLGLIQTDDSLEDS